MENFDMLFDPVRGLLLQTGAFLPRLALAAVILVVGWLLAKAVRLAFVKALRALNFHVLTDRAGIDHFLQQGGTTRDTTDLVGAIVFAVVVIAALIVASNGLGLTQVTELLVKVLLFVPRLLVAILILIFGSYFGRFVGQSVENHCRTAGIGEGELIGRGIQYAVMAFVLLLAVDHLDIGRGLIQQTFLIVLAGIVFALALAFGIGGRDRAAYLIERWFPRDTDEHR